MTLIDITKSQRKRYYKTQRKYFSFLLMLN
jgi:hypothetical protein